MWQSYTYYAWLYSTILMVDCAILHYSIKISTAFVLFVCNIVESLLNFALVRVGSLL